MLAQHEVERLEHLKRKFEEQGGDFVALWNRVGRGTSSSSAVDVALGDDEVRKLIDELERELEGKEMEQAPVQSR